MLFNIDGLDFIRFFVMKCLNLFQLLLNNLQVILLFTTVQQIIIENYDVVVGAEADLNPLRPSTLLKGRYAKILIF